MSSKLKRLFVILTCLLCASLSLFVISCSSADEEEEEQQTVTQFGLEQNALKLEVGSTFLLKTVNLNYDGEIEWYSYDQDIVSVDANGTVSALSEGRTVIVVTAGENSASCDVVVTETQLQSKHLVLEISSKAIVLNSANQYNTATLSVEATYNGEKISTDTVEWSSSNAEAVTLSTKTGTTVTVTGMLNGSNEKVSAKIVYNGVTAIATCTVVVEQFAYILPKQDVISMFAGDEDKIVDFDLYVAGEISTAEKANAKFASSNTAIVDVDENTGELTAKSSGTAEIIITYGVKTATVTIEVGNTRYVSTASQFLEIDGAGRLDKFIINADIDLSEYYDGLSSIGVEYFINSFGGILEGNGHTVYGLTRYATSSDTGFSGIFNSISDTAVIKDVKFISDIKVNQKATLVASVNNGSMENCIFQSFAISSLDSYSFFGVNVGKIDKSAFVLNCASTQGTEIIVSNTGYAKFNDSIIVAPALTGSTSVNGITDASAYFTNTYYYENVAGFVNKTAYAIANAGKGETKTLEENNPANYSVDDENILFAGKTAVDYSFSFGADKTFDVGTLGEAINLELPEHTDFKIQIFDRDYKDVTSTTYADGKFTAEYPGDYTILYTYKDGSNLGGTTYSIRVVKNRVELGKNTFTLKLGDTAQITMSDNSPIDGTKYNFLMSDTSIATVDAQGKITAIAKGATTLRVVGKTVNEEHFVAITVQEDYIAVGTADELIAALNDESVTKDTYIVMTNDITVGKDKITYELSENGKTYYAYVAKTFKGTLDGQGYKLSVEIDNVTGRPSGLNTTIGDDICGLFYLLDETSVVKNLNYDFKATFNPNSSSQVSSYVSALTMFLHGEVRDCYLKALFMPSKAINSNEAIIGMMSNKSTSNPKAYCYNVLFDITTKVGDDVVESGYAIRRGTSSPNAIDCAIVRNGSLKEFFGDFNNHASVVLGKNNNCYNTIYDFVNGLNGYNYTTSYTSIPIPDGVKTYSAWSNKWSFNFDEIRLCGKKVTDVTFENGIFSEGSGMYAGVFYWDSSSDAEIFVDGKYVGKTSDGKFDLYGYLQSVNAPVGNYEVLATDGEAATCVIYEIVGLNNDNFKSTIKTANSFEQTQYKYYILTEDVTMDLTKTLGDEFLYGNYYMFRNVYTNIDGRGYKLTVNLENTSANKLFGGLMYELYAELQNVQIVFNATYRVNENSGIRNYLAETIKCGGLKNVAFRITATAITSNGIAIRDEVRNPAICAEIIGYNNRIENSTGICENVIVIHNGLNKFKFTGKTNLGIRFRNVAIVTGSYVEKLADTNNFVTNSCYLSDVNTLIYGGNAKYIGENDNGLSDGTYTFNDLFEQSNFIVNGNELLLYGRRVWIIASVSDDTFVTDNDIV